MVPRYRYTQNLALAARVRNIAGAIVECGVWRGGMIAGIAHSLGAERKYVLFDSFEGLPEAQSVDGERALKWQADTASPNYFNNCSAEMAEASSAMSLAGDVDGTCVGFWPKPTYSVGRAIPRMPTSPRADAEMCRRRRRPERPLPREAVCTRYPERQHVWIESPSRPATGEAP